MKAPITFIGLFVLMLAVSISAARGETLTPQMLTGWCHDARAMATGLNVMPVAQLNQVQSNATSCVGYLRGYLDSEIHIRTLVPQMGPCAAVPDNARLAAIFLGIADQPGWNGLPLPDLMVEFSNHFCPVTAPRTATVIQTPAVSASLPQPIKLKPAAMPAVAMKSIAPQSQIVHPYGP